MGFSQKQVEVAIAAIYQGTMRVEDGIIVLQSNRGLAQALLTDFFTQIAMQLPIRQPFLMTHEVRNVLNLLWKFVGSSDFLFKDYGHYQLECIPDFLCEKLRDNPDEFSDQALERLGEYFQNPALIVSAHKVITDRVIHGVKRLKEQSTQFRNDIVEVQKRASLYNFPKDLNDLLDKVEEELYVGDKFDQVSTLRHLRTFFERLHNQVATTIRTKKPETSDNTPINICGRCIDFLKEAGVLPAHLHSLAKSIYSVLSSEGGHAIKSEREYVRLCRNMVAEYALILFFELDRRLTSDS